MDIRPIPKKLLVHSIEYEEFLRDGPFGEEFGEKETISDVLVHPKTLIYRDTKNEEIQINAVIFLDAVNTPSFKPLAVKSKVYFNGKEWRVYQCEPYYAFNPDVPHHYEVMIG